MATDDIGNTDAGGAITDTDTVEITVVDAVNDPPVNAVPGPQSVAKNGTLAFSAAGSNQISVADPDAGGADVVVLLSVTDATHSLTVADAGVAVVAGNDTNSVSITGPLAAVNAELDTLVFTPKKGFAGAETLTVESNDQGYTGSGGPRSDVDAVGITVN